MVIFISILVAYFIIGVLIARGARKYEDPNSKEDVVCVMIVALWPIGILMFLTYVLVTYKNKRGTKFNQTENK